VLSRIGTDMQVNIHAASPRACALVLPLPDDVISVLIFNR